MKSTALLIPFFRYPPREGKYYKVYFDALLKGLAIWGDEVDKVYLIDQEWNFSPQDLDKLRAIKPNSEILRSDVTGHHWEQFKWAIPKITEDRILFLDNDVLIWKREVIKEWLSHDFALTFDGSGGLKEQVQEKFPILKKNDSIRMGSYYFTLPRKIFEEIPDYDFAPKMPYPTGTYIKELDYYTMDGDWSDSFGLFTIKLLNYLLTPNFYRPFHFIEDDRSSISIIGNTGISKRLGYYHIRNGNLPIYTLASKIAHPEDYKRTLEITPIAELTRLFAWFDYISPYHNEILEVLRDVDIDEGKWNDYMKEFRNYHGL